MGRRVCKRSGSSPINVVLHPSWAATFFCEGFFILLLFFFLKIIRLVEEYGMSRQRELTVRLLINIHAPHACPVPGLPPSLCVFTPSFKQDSRFHLLYLSLAFSLTPSIDLKSTSLLPVPNQQEGISSPCLRNMLREVGKAGRRTTTFQNLIYLSNWQTATYFS